jgi:Uma2 family endonuclease
MKSSPYHQTVCKRLGFLLYLIEKQKGIGEVFAAPVQVILEEGEVYQPDLSFILKDHLEIIKEDAIEGTPDLIIEVLSADTAYFDLRHKKKAYAKYGVKEYWIVDPMEQGIEIFENRNEDFVLLASATGKGQVRSRLLSGLELNIEEIF